MMTLVRHPSALHPAPQAALAFAMGPSQPPGLRRRRRLASAPETCAVRPSLAPVLHVPSHNAATVPAMQSFPNLQDFEVELQFGCLQLPFCSGSPHEGHHLPRTSCPEPRNLVSYCPKRDPKVLLLQNLGFDLMHMNIIHFNKAHLWWKL